MGLDWCVDTYEKGTYNESCRVKGNYYTITGDEDNEYVGVSYVRGKNVAYLLNKYGEPELADACYGEEIFDKKTKKIYGPFISKETLSKIYSALSSYELKEEEDWSVHEQYAVIHEEVGSLVSDLEDYEGPDDVKVYCCF